MSFQSPPDPDLDARWAAWQARGAARDAAFRRRLSIVVPAAIVFTIIVYALLVR